MDLKPIPNRILKLLNIPTAFAFLPFVMNHLQPQVLKLLQGDNDTVEWARSEVNARADMLDDEMPNQESDIQSHLNLALLDVKDDLNSISSTDHTSDSLTSSASAENYLQWRCSHSSSFD